MSDAPSPDHPGAGLPEPDDPVKHGEGDTLVEHTVWSEDDVDPAGVEAAMRALERERVHRSPGAMPARALNLVALADAEYAGELTRRLDDTGRNQPSRTVLLRFDPRRKELGARVTLAAPPAGRSGPASLVELVRLDVGPRHVPHLATIVDPVVMTDVPTLLWSPHGHREALRRIRPLGQTIMLDSSEAADERAGLEDARELAGSGEDGVAIVDLSWLRTTPWRQRLAATFAPARHRDEVLRISEVEIPHRAGSATAGWLVGGWLADRLAWEPDGTEPGLATDAAGEPVRVTLREADTSAPGLAGLTVRLRDGGSFSLARNPGGLRAHRVTADGHDRTWTVLGASRGEPGVLATALRRTLVPDDGYRGALLAARRLFPWT